MMLQCLFVGTIVCCLSAAGPSWGQDKVSPQQQKAIDAVRKFIDAKGAKGAGDITIKAEEALKKTFPEFQFVNARFRQFPVARIVPEGLTPSNVFAVTKENKVEYVKDAKALEKFFKTNHPNAKDAAEMKTMLAAWLTLAQEFHQDGFFKFEVLQKEFIDQGKDSVVGRAMVTQGGNGQLNAKLVFVDSKLQSVEDKAAIRPGPRPICQATLMLSTDPLVRRIAEQDLLIMGVAAHGYMMEQRERATPELRDAIDRLWQRMQKNGW